MAFTVNEVDPQIFNLISHSRDKYRALVDGLDDEIMSIDPEFRILAVNKAMAESLGLHPRELIGRVCHELIYGFDSPCPDHGLPCPAVDARHSGAMEIQIHELPDPDPKSLSPRFLDVRALPVPNVAGVHGETLLVRRDVTAQKRAEIQLQKYNEHLEAEVAKRTAELVKANDDLTQANNELLKLQQLKEDLTNMVVHDLKGPLAEIKANLAMMAESETDEFQAELLDAAKLGSNDLERMVLNLLDVSRLEENRMVLDRRPLDAGWIVREAIERLEPLARLHEVHVGHEIAEDLSPLYADEGLLRRVLNNLLSNALEHTPEDGRIVVSVRQEGDLFHFMVTDTGKGIPAELHERIFEKFSQGTTGRPKTGSGLGLTFCRLAVTAHGGRIGVESEPGRGSRFTFTIPNPSPLEGDIDFDNE